VPRRFPRSSDRLPSCSQGATARGRRRHGGVDAVFGTTGGGLPAEADSLAGDPARLMAAGQLTVPVWRDYPLAEAAAAYADLEAGRNHGKIVLLP
jgi:NADPH:quinone reductase-like Zn-dependent oxidoreductase